MEIKNILAATDLSPHAGRAVERAACLAVERGAGLHLLHVLPAMSWKIFGKVLSEHPLVTEKQLHDAALAQVQTSAGQIRARHGIAVQASVVIGRPHLEIAKYARAHAIDLTVMGAHAENFVRDIFVGPTTLKFLRTGTHPVMIPRSPQVASHRNVLVPVDFSDLSRIALRTALDFAPAAAVCALHVYDVLYEGKMFFAGIEPDVVQQYRRAAHEEAKRQMTDFLADFPAHVVPSLRHGYPARTIIDEAAFRQADLVVMGKRGGVEIDKMLLGSVTENVLFELERDLLLVGEASRPTRQA